MNSRILVIQFSIIITALQLIWVVWVLSRKPHGRPWWSQEWVKVPSSLSPLLLNPIGRTVGLECMECKFLKNSDPWFVCYFVYMQFLASWIDFPLVFFPPCPLSAIFLIQPRRQSWAQRFAPCWTPCWMLFREFRFLKKTFHFSASFVPIFSGFCP